MTEIEWAALPARKPSRVETVAKMLRSKPGEWACIQRRNPLMSGWWVSLRDTPGFQVEMRKSDPDDTTLFGPCDIYARYVAKDES